jgi:hypothetical protein
MKKYFKLKNLLIALLIVFVVMQVVRIDTKNPATNPSEVLSEANMTPEVKNLLSVACYDCHSNNTRYPWYSNIAPVSWWLQNHVREGREELNFSEWNSMDARKKDHKLKECVEMIEEGEMPNLLRNNKRCSSAFSIQCATTPATKQVKTKSMNLTNKIFNY